MAETLVNKTQAGEGLWTADNLVAGTDISITQVPQPVIDANTLGVWHFENNLDNAVSESSCQITTASPNFTTDYKKFGSYSQYDTLSAQYVLFPSTALTGTFTLDFWAAPGTWTSKYIGLNTSSAAGSNRAYNGPLFVGLQGDSTAKISFNTIATSGTNVVSVTANSWHHIALEVEEGAGRIYLDGELKYTTTGLTGTYYLHCSQANGSGATGIFQPKIDELRLSNVARYQGNNFTPFTSAYAASAGPAQYAINNTKADPDLSGCLQNTATATNSLTINGTANTASATSVNIGDNSQAVGGQSVAIGPGTTTSNSAYNGGSGVSIGFAARGNYTWDICIGREAVATANSCICIGTEATASAQKGISIGSAAKAQAQNAIQLGTGTNSTASTFQVFSTQVVNASGKIPLASTDITSLTGYDATKTQVLKNVNGTLTWVDEA